MSFIHAEASLEIEAPAEKIYAVLADYQKGHPAILPKAYFKELTVEQGGQGAGTVIRVHMSVYGTQRTLRMQVTEPQPGRLLVESDPQAGVTTSFKLEPLNGAARTRLTIATDSKAGPGLQGWFEKLFNPSITKRIYKEELRQIAAYVQSPPA